jgi:putative flavoprotein involved in K+ transport
MFVDTLVVGGGHCGVNLALWFQQEHSYDSYLIVEAKEVLAAWKHSRWNGFQLNTPHNFSLLHGQPLLADLDPTTLGSDFQKQRIGWLSYIREANLNIREGCRVTSIQKLELDQNQSQHEHKKARFCVETDKDTILCRNVICCSGENAVVKLPKALSPKLPSRIPQVHCRDFSSPEQFPDSTKAILVVGSGQSGVQIADWLADHHKKVWLATSMCNGTPRYYRGRNVMEWFHQMALLDTTDDDQRQALPHEESRRYGRKPFVGSRHAISYFSLARKGVQILGSLDDIRDHQFIFKENRLDHIQKSVESYDATCQMVKEFAATLEDDTQLESLDETNDLPEPEWEPTPDLMESNGPLTIDLEDCQGVIWCTGFSSNVTTYIEQIPEALEDLDPITKSPAGMQSKCVDGLYYSGFPWLYGATSDILSGFDREHKLLSEWICNGDK